MIDYSVLMDELEQQTAALEAAVAQQDYEAANTVMLQRVSLLEALSNTPSDNQIQQEQLRQLSRSILAAQQELSLRLLNEKEMLARELLQLVNSGKAAKSYNKNR